ncbi:MAG: DUF6288 domain-containing protein [Phycisphaeraceae bacterium]|nr:DUF6288 domain-containing protein [Phycisphaeraceae bacterium]
MIKQSVRWAIVLGLFLPGLAVVSRPAGAVYEKGDGSFPWDMTYRSRHDQPITDKLGKGFFLNIGPTGLRARITHKHPAYFTIKFVFDKSPAAGKIKAGDIVIGANGRIMKTPHYFGRRRATWKGPMTEMAALIEDAQGRDGKLELIVWPGGDQRKQKKVTLQLKLVGRFSKTFPYNCPRTDKLVRRLCDFLAREYQHDRWKFGRTHTHSAAILALMASGDKKYWPLVKQIMSGYGSKRFNPDNGGGFPTWGWGYTGIVMGEYYLLTKDKSLLPAIVSLNNAYELGQDWRSGGFSHKPFPFIQKRIAGGGPKGYGAMAQPGGLAFVAMSLFKEAGLEYSQRAHERLHQAYLHSWSPKGGIGYGFRAWDHAVIKLKDDSRAQNKKGIGYLCPTGMKDIGKYEIVWPTKKDPRYKDPSWVHKEAATNTVFMKENGMRLVVRTQWKPEPKGPYATDGLGKVTSGGTGQGALGNIISAGPSNPSWRWLGEFYANACANSPEHILRGHASTLMSTLWNGLGASRAEPKRFRSYMDQVKWWYIMAETHDGGFVVMPGHDYASTDHVYGTRVLPTATAALILSVKDRRLMITGAEPTGGSMHNPMFAIQSDGFRVTHCRREARYLAGEGPIAPVLRSLEAAAKKDDPKGREAAVFAEKLTGWLEAYTQSLLDRSYVAPARTLLQFDGYLKRIRGLPQADAIVARKKEILADRNIPKLIAAYRQFEKIEEFEKSKGPSRQSQTAGKRLTAALEKMIARPDLEATVRTEARALLAEVTGDKALAADLREIAAAGSSKPTFTRRRFSGPHAREIHLLQRLGAADAARRDAAQIR